MQQRVIFHIDVNSAFLSWEAVERLQEGEQTDLRQIVSAVAGDVEKRHGVILAKSIPAKKYHIVTGEPVVDALKKCPDLVLVKPRHDIYRMYSAKFMEILRRYSDCVEQFSIDEAFVDMTGMQQLFGPPVEAAERIKNQIRDELGFTVNIGISSNKMLAKMASDFQKPDRVHTLFPDEIASKMWPLPVGDLLYAGKSTVSKLNGIGIFTIGDLAKTELLVVTSHLKKHGEVLWRYANGLDDSPVEPVRADNKGYGHSTTLPFDVTDAANAHQILLSLTEKVCQRLRADAVRADTVTVQIKYKDLTKASHQCTLPAPTNITDEIYRAACRLFDEKWDGEPVRLLGVSTKVAQSDGGRQMSLFDHTDYEKLERLDKALDAIKGRYGAGSVRRASLMECEKDGGKDKTEKNKT